MKKIAVATCVAVLCLVAGFGAGRISSPGGRPGPPEADPGVAPDPGATDRNIVDRSRLDRALEELRDARESLRDLESRNAELEATLASSADTSATEAGADALEGSGIDWSGFAESFAQIVGPLARILPGGPGSDLWKELSREDQASILEFVAACRRVGSQADSITEEPFFDPVILGELLEAACGESLGLSAEQIATLKSLGETVLAQAATSLDLAAATPLEKHRLRREMVDALTSGIRVGLTEDQGIRFEEIAPAVDNLLVGTSGLTEIGIEWNRARDAIAGTVEHQYALTPDQLQSATVQAVVSDYMDGARRILTHYGQAEEPPLPLDPVTRDRMAREFFELQLSMEDRVLPLLTPEQHAEALGRIPHVLTFAPGDTFRNIPMLGTMF